MERRERQTFSLCFVLLFFSLPAVHLAVCCVAASATANWNKGERFSLSFSGQEIREGHNMAEELRKTDVPT